LIEDIVFDNIRIDSVLFINRSILTYLLPNNYLSLFLNNYLSLFLKRLLLIFYPEFIIESIIPESINYLSIRYLFDISQYILLPMYSFIRLFVYSFDVIHTLGFYSWGIKIDAIPGRINLATTLRLINKGEYRGKCFELCGQGHLSMFINTIVL